MAAVSHCILLELLIGLANSISFPSFRRYGQPLRVPMCVVIQEMVASEVAGVMFTVDPVSKDPLRIVVTANYGLGEVCSNLVHNVRRAT